MKKDIHPEYKTASISCVCGATYEVGTTSNITKIDICSACHPFYTGKQKVLDSEGRIEKFRKKFGNRYAKKK